MNYEWAIESLNGRRARPKERLEGMRGSDDMVEWLQLIGHSLDDIDRLNIIHISGTNGKGSTCCFTSSLLHIHARRTGYPQKVGLYTSPHMKTVRERIQINGEPVSEELFTKRFFEVWNRLPAHPTESLDTPKYLQLLALVSLHIFVTENVNVAILETHLGGEFDATNVIKRPIVTAVTSIAMDHVLLLGPTIEDIAWHKAGIFKNGVPAFSVRQIPAVSEVLEERAAVKTVTLEFVDIDGTIPTDVSSLRPWVQKQNCSLALAIVRAWLKSMGQTDLTSTDIWNGVTHFQWPGRFQKITEGAVEWYLDGAHNDSGITQAVRWYAESIKEPLRHFSRRDGAALLRHLAQNAKDAQIRFQHVILTSYNERRDGKARIDRRVQKSFDQEALQRYEDCWRELDADTEISVTRTIEEALDRVRESDDKTRGVQALVTGSLNLVGGALYILDPA